MKNNFFPTHAILCQIELEQILGLNQDLAPTNYDNANVIPNKLQKVSQTLCVSLLDVVIAVRWSADAFRLDRLAL